MNIVLDISPLTDDSKISHRVRGTGFYIKNLKRSLLEFFPNNRYTFFSRGQSIPHDIDIVHYPYFEPFFLTLPFRKKYKTVVTVHDLTPFVFSDKFPIGIRGRIKWLLHRRNLRNVDAIIADSQVSKKDIIKYAGIPESKITVVYLAAGEEFKRIRNEELGINSLRNKYNLPEKFALYVGDVTWNKNLPRLIRAVKKTNIPLVMVGKALLQKEFDKENAWNQDLIIIQNLIKNDKQITSIGFVPTEELVLLYNIATVFVMPSLYEGFGLPILEAMQCGCPVITTKEGSLKEITGDAVFFVDAYDIESIASGIERVIKNKRLQRELSEKGLIQAKKFSWKETARKTMQVYKKIYEKTH
ncbi:MAG: glycosyltransferase family 4 protein [Candidatus Levyibacteriota bacterium]|nr:MAG: glycosyltransferase family 4 protein [Candidatus Levybacteria bacterium]